MAEVADDQDKVGRRDHKVSNLKLRSCLRAALLEAQYHTVQDVLKVSSAELASELRIPLDEAEQVIQAAQASVAGEDAGDDAVAESSTSASALLARIQNTGCNTGNDSLDKLLISARGRTTSSSSPTRKGKETAWQQSALQPGTVLEICGPPGGGKSCIATSIILQTLRNSETASGSQNRDKSGRRRTEALLVDTEGAHTADRLVQLATASNRGEEGSLRDTLDRIHLLRISTQFQMIAFVHTFDQWLRDHPAVSLIVVDSLSLHFRQPGLDLKFKNRMMEQIKTQMGRATALHKCTVVVTNQLATKLVSADNKPANFDTGDRAILMPSLGDAWLTPKTIRLLLFRGDEDGNRYAHASTAAAADILPWVRFDINSEGLPCDPLHVNGDNA